MPTSEDLALEKVALLADLGTQRAKQCFDGELFLGPNARPGHGRLLAERLRRGVHLQEALSRDPMIFTETSIEGVWVVEPERHEDERSFFARTWDPEEFVANGLNARLAQCIISFNASRSTLRGLHYQAAPHEEAKLVRCTADAMFDVALDLRAHSPTFRSWFG